MNLRRCLAFLFRLEQFRLVLAYPYTTELASYDTLNIAYRPLHIFSLVSPKIDANGSVVYANRSFYILSLSRTLRDMHYAVVAQTSYHITGIVHGSVSTLI